ncbi:hypothetical protein IT418_03310 [bacterium]|nr:hypothetical protein [bacterium]
MAQISISHKTKAEVLSVYKEVVKESIIDPLYFFTVAMWNRDRDAILRDIQERFYKKIVVRSASVLEDQNTHSNAGKFASILNVMAYDKNEVQIAINKVVASYRKGKDLSEDSQILIQEQLENSILSGVVFTANPKNGAPYYLINYDEENQGTDSITSGKGGQQLRI